MAIDACPELLRLAVKGLHHERIENADLLQCFHVAMDAGECCVETVEEIVHCGLDTPLELGTLINSVSFLGRLLIEGELW